MLFEISLPAQILGFIVYWGFVNVDFWSAVLNKDGENMMRTEFIDFYWSTFSSIFVTFVPILLLLNELLIDNVVFGFDTLYSSSLVGLLFSVFWAFSRLY
jgi:hypothetical protein